MLHNPAISIGWKLQVYFCMYELLVGTIALKDISRKQWNTVNIGTTQVKMIQTINMEQFLQKTIMVH